MPDHFLKTLDGVASRIRRRILGTTLMSATALAAGAVALGAAVDAFARPLHTAGRVLILVLALAGSAIAGLALLGWARRLWSRLAVARAMEGSSPQDRELFVTALAVAEEPADLPPSASEDRQLRRDLGHLLLARAGRRSTELDPASLVARHRRRWPALALGCVAAAWLVGGAISRDFRLGLLRTVWPWAARSPAAAAALAKKPAPGLQVDRPPVVKLERPAGPEILATAIDAIDCEVRATDDRGLARLGLEMLVDADRSRVATVTLDGQQRDVTRNIQLQLQSLASGLPNLGPDRSVLLWAFAEDRAGQRAVSAPVVLEIQALYQAESARKGGGGGGGVDLLEQLISDQRALARKTFPLAQEKPAVPGSAPLAEEQQALLARARKMNRP